MTTHKKVVKRRQGPGPPKPFRVKEGVPKEIVKTHIKNIASGFASYTRETGTIKKIEK